MYSLHVFKCWVSLLLSVLKYAICGILVSIKQPQMRLGASSWCFTLCATWLNVAGNLLMLYNIKQKEDTVPPALMKRSDFAQRHMEQEKRRWYNRLYPCNGSKTEWFRRTGFTRCLCWETQQYHSGGEWSSWLIRLRKICPWLLPF